MSKNPSIGSRAALAIFLFVGFYILALGLSAVLLFVAYEVFTNTHGYPSVKLGGFCLVGAGIIMWSILPRFDKFRAPGPQLTESDQPELFALLKSVANDAGEAMPSEVFLLSDVNAWVAQRGGVLGVGSRRIMGVGLPVLQILNVTELRAVLAHEFGHYYGGDTRLGPLVYNMRAAMGRTIHNLARRNSILQAPFVWYGTGALKLTQDVSRRQEHSADELAARLAGPEHLSDALRKIHGAQAFLPYLIQEISPLLDQDVRPKLAEGFGQFLAAPRIQRAVDEQLAEEIANGKGEQFDSHPPLQERLQALSQLPKLSTPADSRLAVTLLRNLDQMETALLAQIFDREQVKGFRSIPWNRVSEEVYLPAWRTTASNGSEGLRGVTPMDFPMIAADLPAFGKRFTNPRHYLPPDDLAKAGREHLCCAFALRLYQGGWQIWAPPGEPIVLLKGGSRIEPFNVLTELKEGKIDAESWKNLCQANGITDWDLGATTESIN